jgi:hypothetical protein
LSYTGPEGLGAKKGLIPLFDDTSMDPSSSPFEMSCAAYNHGRKGIQDSWPVRMEYDDLNRAVRCFDGDKYMFLGNVISLLSWNVVVWRTNIAHEQMILSITTA